MAKTKKRVASCYFTTNPKRPTIECSLSELRILVRALELLRHTNADAAGRKETRDLEMTAELIRELGSYLKEIQR